MSDALIGKRWRDDGITWVVRKVERVTHEGWTYDCALYKGVPQIIGDASFRRPPLLNPTSCYSLTLA